MLWKRKKDKPTLADKVIPPVAKLLSKAQFVFGSNLNRWTGKWTRRKQLIFLWSFAACMMGVIFLQLYHRESEHQVAGTTHQPTLVPLQNGMGRPKPSHRDTLIIQRFHARIRQMQMTPQGRDSLREFIRQRPGFIDSVIAWENSMK